MPNWAEGNIRFRGKRDNLINFLKHELVEIYDKPDGTIGERNIHFEEINDGWSLLLRRTENTRSSLYFRGSSRQFIDSDKSDSQLELSNGKNQNVDQIIVMSGFRGAWGIDDNIFHLNAVKYKIDIRIFAWERGMQWSTCTTYLRNGDIEGKTKTYEDWLWNASMPFYGG